MKRIAFLIYFPLEYKGGVNYFRNLMYAISLAAQKKYEVFLFVPENMGDDLIASFSQYATVVKTPILTRKKAAWVVDKVMERFFDYVPLTIRLLKKYKIDVVSHSNFCSKWHSFPVANWIPDFQWLHYPDLWNKHDYDRTLDLCNRLIKFSDTVIVSSHDSKKDLQALNNPKNVDAEVLQFVSQPDSKLYSLDPNEFRSVLENKYAFKGRFFYLPNQFWVHKNHIVVFKAIKLLKEKGIQPLLITTGLMKDYRNGNEHIEQLRKYVADNGLEDNIKFLGLIPYEEVLFLMKSCVALINPSLFEGWSSTVEEAKSIGKLTILSNIAVHQEQNPAGAIYFDPHKEEELAAVIEKVWNGATDANNEQVEAKAKADLEARTIKFGQRYLEIIIQTYNKKKAGGKRDN